DHVTALLPPIRCPCPRPSRHRGRSDSVTLDTDAARSPGSPLTPSTAPSAVVPNSLLHLAPPRHAPRGVLLSRDMARYRYTARRSGWRSLRPHACSLLGLAMHSPERRQARRNLGSTALVLDGASHPPLGDLHRPGRGPGT